MAMELTSPAFENGAEIPARHSCEGADTAPPLAWAGVPDGTRSLVLVVDDPDAPDPRAPKVTWVHWVLYDIPPDVTALPEAVTPAGLPAGVREGLNGWGSTGYRGPCPPIGRHRYFFKLYALDTVLGDLGPTTKDAVLREMDGHLLDRTELVGTYEKA